MEPIINLEDEPGKTVGRRKPPSDPFDLEGQRKVDMMAWHSALHSCRIPRGVYRFKTHEEADEWTMKMMTRLRKES